MFHEGSAPADRRTKRFGVLAARLEPAIRSRNLQEPGHIGPVNVEHPLVLALVLRDHFDLGLERRRNIDVELRLEPDSGGRVHIVDERNFFRRRGRFRLDERYRRHMDAVVDNFRGRRVVRIIVVFPVAEDDVRGRDPERLDKRQPCLARVEQELVVEIEHDQFRADDRRARFGLVAPNRFNLLHRMGRGADIAARRNAEKDVRARLRIQCGRAARIGFNVVRMRADK